MGIRRRMRRLGLSVLCCATLGVHGVVGSGPTGLVALRALESEDVQSLLNKGWFHFEEGDLDAALGAFEKALAQNPTSDAILGFVESVTAAKVYGMVRSSDPRIAGLGRKLLELSRSTVVAKGHDPAEIQKAIDDVFASRDREQLVKLIEYTLKYGRNLVPYLVPRLADSDLARRGLAINWIVRIGLDAVPVLQAARKHSNATVRRNVADLLGARSLRHAVSLGTLKAFMEKDPASDVKEAAERSFLTILSELDGQARPLAAKEYFLENAYHQYYLNPHRNPFASTFYLPTIYKLEKDAIVEERVADFQLSPRMAQQALEEALDLAPDFAPARVLCLCNDAAQVAEYDLNVAYYARTESNTGAKEILDRQRPYVDFVLRNRLLAPPEILYDALLQAIDDEKSAVAQKVLETIRETGPRGTVPDSLLKALEDSNSRLVRTAAAVVLAYWNPLAGFDAGEQVVDILGDAIYTSGIRTAQKIMGDTRLANRFDSMLRDLNMESYSPIESIEAGYGVVVRSPPDVVFMDESARLSVESTAVAPINYFVNELRKNYRSANVPVIVVVPESRLVKAKETYESQERKVWVVPESIDRVGLEKSVLDKLFADKSDAKTLATRLAARAAGAVNHLAAIPTRIPVRKCVPTLRKVLYNRPDEVRIPCIRALGNLRAADAASELAVVFSQTENAADVRLEAMLALGKALAAMDQGASPEILTIIRDGMDVDDLALRRAAWFAFSTSKPPATVQLEALLSQPPAGGGAPAVPGGPEAPAGPEEDATDADEPEDPFGLEDDDADEPADE